MKVTGFKDHSGTIAVGTTAQDAAAANIGRVYLFIQNLDAAEDLWVNFSADAAIATAGSIQVKPGLYLQYDKDAVPGGRVSVNATTGGHKYTVKDA